MANLNRTVFTLTPKHLLFAQCILISFSSLLPWQVGSCDVCCGCTGGKICEHCRAESCRCWQNPPATFQTGKDHLCCISGVSIQNRRVLLISSNPSYLGISLQTELYNLLDSVYGRWQLFLLPFFKIFPCFSICLFTWRSSKRVFSMRQVTCLFFSSLVFNLLSWLLSSTEMLQDMWGIPVMGEGLQQKSNCT